MTEIVPPDGIDTRSGAQGPPRPKLDPEILEVVAPQSPGVVFWTQMRKSPLAIAGGIVLAIFYLLALFAPFVAPYPQEEMDRGEVFPSAAERCTGSAPTAASACGRTCARCASPT